MSRPLAALDRRIAVLKEELRRLVIAREVLEVTLGVPAATRPAKAMRIAPGSLESRILDAAQSPIAMSAIVAAAKAKQYDVIKAVRSLVASGRLQKLGAGPRTRYQRRDAKGDR